MARPKDQKQLADIIRAAKSPFEIIGAGTKRNLGRPMEMTPLDLSAFNFIEHYEPEELILEAGAAARLDDVQNRLARKNQMLAFEPPNLSRLLGSAHAGTIGGALMCNLSGPRRVKAGAARDHVLGVSGVNGNGEIFKAGARVVKNVTGYDVPRLMAGSYGTLAALTSVIFKVLPKPETEVTLHVKCDGPAEAIAVMSKAMGSSAEVSSAAFVPGQGVYLRLEGISASVAYRCVLVSHSDALPEEQSVNLWTALRDVAPLWKHKDLHIWRISVPPTDAPRMISELKAVDYFCDWAGGLIWLAAKPGTNVRAALRQGHATLFRADEETRKRLDVFHPQAPDLAALSARVKRAFDPRGLFNPGRMYKGV